MASAALVRFNEVRDGVAELLRYARKGLPENFVFSSYHYGLDGSRFPRFRAAVNEAFLLAGMLACALVGHGRLDSCGHAGPESAHESVWCTRCGRTLVDHWYY